MPLVASLCFYITVVVIASASVLIARTYMSQQPPPPFMRVPHLQIAHRGYSAGAPENTVAAFKTAVDKRVAAVEVDLMLSKDGEIVVAHDYDLETWTNGHGRISDKTWAELSNVTVTRGGKTFTRTVVAGIDDKLARFQDILIAAQAGNVNLMIELKTVTNTSYLIRKVAELLKARDYIQHTLVTSFFPGMLMEFQRHAPSSYTLLLYSHTAFRSFCSGYPAELRSTLFFSIACAYPEVADNIASYIVEPIAKFSGAISVGLDIENPHFQSLATRSLGWGLHVVAWTVNSASQRETVHSVKGNERGAIAILSDCPHGLCGAEH